MKTPMRTFFAGAGLLAISSLAHGADLWRVYQIAAESDPQLAAAQAAYQAAQEVKPQSRAALLPQLNASANWSKIETTIENSGTLTQNYNAPGYSLTLVQPVFHWDSWVAFDQADSRIAQAKAQYGGAQEELALRVSQAYFNVLAASDNLEFAQAEVKATEQQLRQVEQRYKVGLSAITDVHEARAGYDAAVAQEIAASNTLAVAKEALLAITGVPFDTLAPLRDRIPLVTPNPADIDAWVKTATHQNLQLLAAAAAAQVASLEVERTRAGHYPTLDLQAQHSYYDTTDAGRATATGGNLGLGVKTTDNTITLNLSVPIYSGGLTSSRVRQANYLYNQSREQLESQRRTTVRQTREAYLNVVAGISQVDAQRQAVTSAKTALEATQAGYEVGTRTAVDVLNAQRQLYGAQRDFARARYDYILATLNLKQAAGTLSADDIRAVNGWLKTAETAASAAAPATSGAQTAPQTQAAPQTEATPQTQLKPPAAPAESTAKPEKR